ncbi:RnfABCDGE type electron transport complex subunit D [Candidatus Woesearchaeota archaeon]|nr:RnfABCDGE type electron transport complex subunit D [Candidatus Woesearchaeota archaeon]
MQKVTSPHIHARRKTAIIMWIVVLSLLPAAFFGIYNFGLNSFFIILVSVLVAVITELVINKLKKERITIADGSAALTGLLLGLCMSPRVPMWIPAVGSFVAIAIAKHAFGGLGHNIFNPALVGRAFLIAAWPIIMNSWVAPVPFGSPAWLHSYDAVTSATPLGIEKIQGHAVLLDKYPMIHSSLFFGNTGGTIGEVSAFLLLIGGLFMIITEIIDWRIPLGYIGTVALGAFALGKDPLFYLLAGGLFLGAFFMATDYVTSPLTRNGRWIFAVCCGILTIVMRLFAGMPEGVMYSILIMNAFVPLIDRFIRPKRFGT